MEYNVDDSDRSSSPPPTPTDKPLRSKRSHRKNTPPPGPQSGGLPATHTSPGSVQHHQILHPLNPMSSAQSTPDPSSRPNPFFSSVPPAVTSPHAVNGTAPQPSLPPLHSLPPLNRPPETSRYFDPAYERTEENDADATGRQRALSGAQAPQPIEPRDVQNGHQGDTEMGDAPAGGFTAVNVNRQ